MNTKMRIALYLRFSDPKQIGNTSIETQEKICRNSCEANSWGVVDVAKNEAVSADEQKSGETHRVADLLEYCKKLKGKIDILMVFKLDRFARSQMEHHYLRNELKKMGILLRSATEQIDESPSGELVEGVLAAVNQYDNSVRRERAKIALWYRVEEGLWPWNVPTGYMKVRMADERLKPFVEDETCSWAVIEIFKKYATGTVTKAQLAREYQAKKIKNHKGNIIRFSPQSIDNILRKIYYAGYVPHKDKGPIKGLHKALITLELFNKCQDEVKTKSNNNTKKRNRNNPQFPLRHFARCEECGEYLTGALQKKQFPLYWCYNRKCSRAYKTIRKADLENSFYLYLKTIKPKEEFVERFKERVLSKYEKLSQDLNHKYKEQLSVIQELEAKKDWIIEKARKDLFDDETLREELAKNKTNIDLAKLELANTHQEELNIDEMLTEAQQFIRTIENAWYDAQSEIKIRLQRWIFPNGVVVDKKAFRTDKLNRLFAIIDTLGTQEINDCELTVSQVEPLFDSVIRTYYKLDELGIKEVDGQIVFIDNMEVSHE